MVIQPIEKDLQKGDLLVFSRRELFDSIIKIKTWSQATHTEIYIGNGSTVASRNGIGCNIYTLDLNGIYCVLRPVQPFDLDKALLTFNTKYRGLPYGWKALFSFVLIDLHDNGIFCSELSTLVYRAGGFEPFNANVKANTVAPADYLYLNPTLMKQVWIRNSN